MSKTPISATPSETSEGEDSVKSDNELVRVLVERAELASEIDVSATKDELSGIETKLGVLGRTDGR